ncbi:MAG: dynamin family protein, partial [Candidatus Binatia bacterium]
MFFRKKSPLEKHLHSLESHLQQENPVLLAVMPGFRELDQVARRLGFFNAEESYAKHVPWWPIVSVLGTYSSGKSTFLNDFLKYKLQATGNQAVDDKFTVICFSKGDTTHVLPGLSLDADPRFPFYKISREIDEVAAGEGRRIDAYLQLKTCPSEKLRGKIFIDSPGFDADEQRTAVLRLTKYIIDLSDLVLVFFDARHPESGTMHDTLEHLVQETIHRPDANKFLFILNQLDTTAREDNAEDVVASWQRALAQKGLTAGRFYRIFSPSAAVAIEDANVRARYESKRDTDLADIDTRVQQVGLERAYRIVGALEQSAKDLQEQIVPKLRTLLQAWRTRVLWLDVVLLAMVAVLAGVGLWLGAWDTLGSLLFAGDQGPWGWGIGLVVVLFILGYFHFSIRQRAAKQVIAKLRREMKDDEVLENFVRAFNYNTRFYRSIFHKEPAGWDQQARDLIKKVLS